MGGIVRGGRAVFADREAASLAPRETNYHALNDNAPSGAGPTESPSLAEILYLRRGLDQPGGKLPLFDLDGQDVDEAVVRRCLERGWATPWFNNPLKPEWLVCKLTETGRQLAAS